MCPQLSGTTQDFFFTMVQQHWYIVYISMLTVECRMRLAMRWTAVSVIHESMLTVECRMRRAMRWTAVSVIHESMLTVECRMRRAMRWTAVSVIHESMLTVECRMRPAMRWTAICCLCLNWVVYKVPSICSTSACPAAAVRMRVKLMVPR